MEQPEGFRQGGREFVCRLNKSLYGLKQSPRLWGETLEKVLDLKRHTVMLHFTSMIEIISKS
jgi:hypothetical protein